MSPMSLPKLTRRRWLAQTLRAVAATVASSTLGGWGMIGCGSKEIPDDGRLRLSLRGLTEGVRRREWHADVPIEIVREGTTVMARSLLCTHFGCEVEWVAADQRYQCPCHDGVFDAQGNVISGPPSRPLRRLPVEIIGDTVLIDAEGSVAS